MKKFFFIILGALALTSCDPYDVYCNYSDIIRIEESFNEDGYVETREVFINSEDGEYSLPIDVMTAKALNGECLKGANLKFCYDGNGEYSVSRDQSHTIVTNINKYIPL